MMWSSILGLPDTILRQSVAEARLGEAETRRATQAFHRASGHGQMTKQVFVHSVVRELLPNFPTALAERLFGCINVDLSGTLKYKEFISTVCVLKVGTPREQLKLVFRVLDSTESGYITRKDVRTMLSWVIPTSVDIVDSVDGGGGVACTAATFESTLFAKAEKLKWETFRVRMMSSGGSICAGGLTLVSWVHALGAAMTFQEHSLPTTPVASAALLPSNELTTTPSTLHVLGLYHAPTTLYPEKMAALHNGFHHLHGLYGHGVGVPKDVLHDTFVRSSVFPASYLDSFNMDNGQSQNNAINLAPTLRDWMLHLAFAAHESMLEGLRCLFDLFADSQTVNHHHPTSAAAASVDGHVSDLTELLYHVVPSPTYLLHAHVILHTHVAPPPLAQHISRWVDQLLVACDTVTFADFCGWLSSEQPDLLHALHECCDMVHVRLLGAAVEPATAIQIVHGLLQVYHPTTNPGVPGQAWFRVDRAMMWTPFLALDDSHMLAAKLPTNNGDFHRHDDINDEVFVNRATYDALCRFYAIMCAECRTHGRNSFAPVEPITAAAAVVRVTNDQRQLESKVYTITILAEATTDAAAAGPANGNVGSSVSSVVLSSRTPLDSVPSLLHLATTKASSSSSPASDVLLYRPVGGAVWLPWQPLTPTTDHSRSTTTLASFLSRSIEAAWGQPPPSTFSSSAEMPPASISPLPPTKSTPPSMTCAVGLSNLGNSCFMNAVLQCLFHTTPLQEYFVSQAYVYDVNVTNTHGMQGVFAAVYGDLARAMASPNRSRPIAPLTFKVAIGKLYPQFQGHLQHDAHECLSVLLQGLNEDLSRPLVSPHSPNKANSIQTTKPYVDLPDSNNRPDSEVAYEWWRAHVLRDPSIITALFTGQFKSAVDCSQCGQTSNRFEPFSFLQVPLPASSSRWRTIYVHLGHGHRIQKRKIQLQSTAVVADLLAALDDQNGAQTCSTHASVVVAIVHSHKVHSIVQPKQVLADIAQDLHVYSYDGLAAPLSGLPSPRRYQCVYRRQRLVPFYFLQPFRVQLYGTPLLVPSATPMTGRDLYKWVHTHLPPSPPSPLSTSSPDMDKSVYFGLPPAFHPTWPFTLRYVRASDGLACSRCPWTSACVGCPVDPDGGGGGGGTADDDDGKNGKVENTQGLNNHLVVLQPHEMLAIDWGLETTAAPVDLHKSYVQFHVTPPPAYPLEECVGMLCSEEVVDMYCSRCLTSVAHTKRLALWSTPPILVVQLKRFQSISETQSMVKADASIRFPATLSLAPFLAATTTKSTNQPNTPPMPPPCDTVNNAICDKEDDQKPDDPVPTPFVWKDDIAVTFPYPTAATDPPGYDLYGIVCHVGVLGAGHYVAYVRDRTTWWCVDDMTVSVVTNLNLSTLMSAAYLLFYQRRDMADVAMDCWFPRSDASNGIHVNVDELRRQVHTWTKPPKRRGEGGRATSLQLTRPKSKYWFNWSWR